MYVRIFSMAWVKLHRQKKAPIIGPTRTLGPHNGTNSYHKPQLRNQLLLKTPIMEPIRTKGPLIGINFYFRPP